MRVDLVTLFPELFERFFSTSMVGRAVSGGQLVVRTRSPREFGVGPHQSVDDTPYGGGCGMVMRVDCLVATFEALDHDAALAHEPKARRVLLTPQGRRFEQADARRLAEAPALMLVSGRYEGFDERVRSHVDEELSLGDFVMTGGEIAAMAVVEAVSRLLPGVLGNADSARDESHQTGLLEHAQYTRPVEFRGEVVPEVLRSGNHQAIAKHRRDDAERRTSLRRPDLARRG